MKNTSPPKTKTPVLPLPPWKPRNPREAQWLIDWTNARLDEEHVIAARFTTIGELIRLSPNPSRALESWNQQCDRWENPTLEYALQHFHDTGDVDLLEQVNPKMAEFLSRKRGRPIKETIGDPIWQAVWDTITIKQLWLEHFGTKNRPDNDKVRAEDIAAKRWRIKTEDDLNSFKRALREPKRGRKERYG